MLTMLKESMKPTEQETSSKPTGSRGRRVAAATIVVASLAGAAGLGVGKLANETFPTRPKPAAEAEAASRAEIAAQQLEELMGMSSDSSRSPGERVEAVTEALIRDVDTRLQQLVGGEGLRGQGTATATTFEAYSASPGVDGDPPTLYLKTYQGHRPVVLFTSGPEDNRTLSLLFGPHGTAESETPLTAGAIVDVANGSISTHRVEGDQNYAAFYGGDMQAGVPSDLTEGLVGLQAFLAEAEAAA